MSAVVAAILLVLGTAFLAVSSIGAVRLPDFFTRAHAVAKSETLGLFLVVAGLAVHNGLTAATPRLVFIAVFALIANATAMHAVSRAAIRTGQRPMSRRTP
jgi:multicomponent Na+:H+ antiporter subunit G